MYSEDSDFETEDEEKVGENTASTAKLHLTPTEARDEKLKNAPDVPGAHSLSPAVGTSTRSSATAIVDQSNDGFSAFAYEGGKQIARVESSTVAFSMPALEQAIFELTGLQIIQKRKRIVEDYSAVDAAAAFPLVTRWLVAYWQKALEADLSNKIGAMPAKVVVRQRGKIRLRLEKSKEARELWDTSMAAALAAAGLGAWDYKLLQSDEQALLEVPLFAKG